MSIILKNYPSVIDPHTNCLELRVEEEELEGSVHWETWSRPLYEPEQLPFELTPAGCHLFGLAEQLQDCPYALCYASNGRLASIWWRTRTGWERADAPEESSGAPPLHPSVRLVFSDNDDSLQFMDILRRMQRAAQSLSHPSAADAHELVQIISRGPCQPRFLDVHLLPMEDDHGG